LSNSNRISIVIPTLPHSKTIELCIAALFDMAHNPEEIILVVDGSESEISFSILDKVKICCTGYKQGPAAARNLGSKQAIGDYIWFIDSDVLVKTQTLGLIEEYLEKESTVTAIIGSYDTSPYETNFLSQYKNLSHHYIHQKANEKSQTFWTGCGIVKREAFNDVGGFNSQLFLKPSVEDIELGYRLSAEGYTIMICKEIQVKHLKKWTLKNLIKTDLFQRAIPWTKLLLQKNNWENNLNIRRLDRISVFVTFLMLGFLIFSLLISPNAVYYTLFIIVFFVFLHWDYYKFFYNLKGIIFTIQVIPNHVFSYIIAGIGFIIGNIEHRINPTTNG